MSHVLAAEFDTRREAEMTVEHLVQEHGLDRKSITVLSASDANSAGTRVAGSDADSGQEKPGANRAPALTGTVKVSVDAGDAPVDKILSTFATYNGRQVDG